MAEGMHLLTKDCCKLCNNDNNHSNHKIKIRFVIKYCEISVKSM